jgi:hypothetical protein
MPIPLPNPITQSLQSNTARTLAQHHAPEQTWKLNQLLNAQVVRLSTGETGLKINGQIYTPVSPLGLPPGTTRQLKVASLGPVFKLAWVNNDKAAEIPVRLVNAAANSMSNSLWASIVATGPYKLATLLTLMQNPPRVMAQYLPAQTQATFTAVSALLPKPGDLSTDSQIKALLTSLTLNGQPSSVNSATAAASPLATLLQRLQQQLLLQIQNSQNSAPQHKALASYKADQAMRASLATALLNLLDEATLTNTHRYSKTSTSDSYYCQWQWQFPLLEGNRGRLLSLSARRHERRNPLTGKPEKLWQLRCACDLTQYGPLAIIIRVHRQQARIHLQCEQEETARRVQKGEPLLSKLLQEQGMQLKRLNSDYKPVQKKLQSPAVTPDDVGSIDFQEHASLTESLNERLRHAAICGELPVLEDFEFQQQRQQVDISEQLPDSVYQVLACLFVFLLDH